MSEHTTEPFADEFVSHRVRKRFLTQMIPLRRLLIAHGFDVRFPSKGSPVTLSIQRNGENRLVFVGTQAGSVDFKEADMVFRMIRLQRVEGSGDFQFPAPSVRSNHLAGLLEALEHWGVLRPNEITKREILEASLEAKIKCGACCEVQTDKTHRFKQCALCSRKDKSQRLPDFNGFYCSKGCQASHWPTHRRRCHAEDPA